jgi:hypothetical protein
VHSLYNASPGRLVRQPLGEDGVFARYLNFIASMDKFAGNADEDGQAAAKARADEQNICGLNDKDQAILQQTADRYRAEMDEHLPRRSTVTGEISRLPIRPREREQMVETYLERLRSELTKPGFEKVEQRAQVLYQSEGPMRVVAANDAELKSGHGETQSPTPIEH